MNTLNLNELKSELARQEASFNAAVEDERYWLSCAEHADRQERVDSGYPEHWDAPLSSYGEFDGVLSAREEQARALRRCQELLDDIARLERAYSAPVQLEFAF